MPHASLKLKPGVDKNETPALNEAGISNSNLIRFIYDRTLGALIQKLGGWDKFYPDQIANPIRALLAWEDTNAVTHLAYGCQDDPITGEGFLGVITNGVDKDITPRFSTDNVPPDAVTVAGSSIVTITDNVTTGITYYDSVFIETHISVGGLVLFGQYECLSLSGTAYEVVATDLFGDPLPAPSSSTAAVVAVFSVSGSLVIPSSVVTVTLPNHGYAPGDTYPILVSTTFAGITLYGNYIVTSVIDVDNFTILSAEMSTASASVSINGGDARYTYSFGVGAAITGSGYGAFGYGVGAYGYGVTYPASTGDPISSHDWSLSNWGQVLLSCPINGTLYQPIYQWDPTSGSPTATVIPNAPTVNDGFFVAMPQRQIIAWGSTFTGIQDPLLIRWCDVNNYDSWVATVTNQAGSYRLPKGSKIVSCIQGPQQGVIWTDLGVWAMQYIGPPYVYSFNELGTGCGLIARHAAASLNNVIYWMGPSQFYKLSGEGIEPVACPIWDVVFQNLDTANLSKIRVAVNSRFGEVQWFYPSHDGGGENDSYIKYNVNLNIWDYGSMSRSAWIDQSVLGPPIGADPVSGYLYQHETSPNADGEPMLSSFRTGYFTMSEADLKTFVDQVWPDMKWSYYDETSSATVNLTFYVTDYAGQTPVQFGPYPMTRSTTFITPRFRGRLVSIELSSSDLDSFWRIGNMRYRMQQDGKF